MRNTQAEGPRQRGRQPKTFDLRPLVRGPWFETRRLGYMTSDGSQVASFGKIMMNTMPKIMTRV